MAGQYIRYTPLSGSGGGGGGITSINSATGPAISILAGTNIGVSTVGNNITISNTAPSGANTTLSNLTSPTTVNQDLLPLNTGGSSLGSSTKGWGAAFVQGNINLRGGNQLRVYESTNSNFVSIQASSSLAANYTLTLPVDDGTPSQVLTTDGSGVLSWTTPATAGANTSLSNLSSPTAVNRDLRPGSDVTFDIGSSVNRWAVLHTQSADIRNLNVTDNSEVESISLRPTGVSTNPNGDTGSTIAAVIPADRLSLYSTDDAGPTGDMFLGSGTSSGDSSGEIRVKSGDSDQTSGNIRVLTGDSASSDTGVIIVRTGNASGNSGEIDLITGTAGGTRGSVVVDALNLDVNSTNIINVLDPVNPQDAATKNYVDLAPVGISGTDWRNDLTFTTTGFGTTTASDFRYRRVGDSMEVEFQFTVGTSTGTNASIVLPGGYTIDSSKLSSQTDGTILGSTIVLKGSAGLGDTDHIAVPFYDGSTTNAVFLAINDNNKVVLRKIGGGAFDNTNNAIIGRFTVPISGWSVNNGSNPPTPSARAFASSTTISGTLATINYTTVDYDNAGGYSGGTYTVSQAGKYQVNAALLVSGTISVNNNIIMEIQKNGSVVSRKTVNLAAALSQDSVDISDIINCALNDTLRIQVSTTATAPSIVSSNFDNYLSISKLN